MAKGRDPEEKKRANREAQRLFRARKHEELQGIKEKLIGREKELKLKEQELKARDRKIQWLLVGKKSCSPLRPSSPDLLPRSYDIPSESTIVPSIEDVVEYVSPAESAGQGQDGSSSFAPRVRDAYLTSPSVPDPAKSAENKGHAAPSEKSKACDSSSHSNHQGDLEMPSCNNTTLGTIDPANLVGMLRTPSPTWFDGHSLAAVCDDWGAFIPKVQRPTTSMVGTAETSSTVSDDQGWNSSLQQQARCADQLSNRDPQVDIYSAHGSTSVAAEPLAHQHNVYSADTTFLPVSQSDSTGMWQTLPVGGLYQRNSDVTYTLKMFSDMLSRYCHEQLMAGSSDALLGDLGLSLDRMYHPMTAFNQNVCGLQPKGLSA